MNNTQQLSVPTQSLPRIEEHPFNSKELYRVPHPSHRHAAPSAPWPWVDMDDEIRLDTGYYETVAPPDIPELCDHSPERCNRCWKGYPQSLFPNWTERQVRKAKVYDAIHTYSERKSCICYRVDVNDCGLFTDAKEIVAAHGDEDLTWDGMIHEQVSDSTRVRAFFVENLSGPILQMLGSKYNIEPFFFSSSLNWIPSRFQEEVRPGHGDHITITLTFPRSVPIQNADGDSHSTNMSICPSSTTLGSFNKTSHLEVQRMIDTQIPLVLASAGRQLVSDLLSVHLIRKKNGSVIISYHPPKDIAITTAQYLHKRILFAGQSVYWQTIFQTSPDPTFLLLTFIWHTIYAWDEALETLYSHICTIEGKVVATTDFNLTQELHTIRAHHLRYTSLLEDLQKAITFVQETLNPVLDSLTVEEREFSLRLLNRECDILLSEVDRLERERSMQERRLDNAMHLVFSSINILDSKQMQKMTRTSVKDSAGMKQIAYLSMVFLPATLAANIFSMNVREMVPGTKGTVVHYAVITVALTLTTAWVITAFQSRYIFRPGVTFWQRLGWPVFLILRLFGKDPYAPTTADSSQRDIQLELLQLDQGFLRERY